ncbi:MAG: ycgR 2 [Firmicutes bacterium]|nr:ycgR 2 [Bacillota bacterium]
MAGEQYHSRIEEIYPDSLVIAMPMSKGYPVMLSKGTTFYGRVTYKGSAYQFSSTLIEKKVHPLPVWIISPPSNIKQIQQRNFVRIDARLSVGLQVIQPNDTAEMMTVISKDISGGGILLVVKNRLYTGDHVKLSIDLPTYQLIRCHGQIVRVEKPQEDLMVYWIAIRFTDILENDRSKIIQYIFKKQLERRQRGY